MTAEGDDWYGWGSWIADKAQSTTEGVIGVGAGLLGSYAALGATALVVEEDLNRRVGGAAALGATIAVGATALVLGVGRRFERRHAARQHRDHRPVQIKFQTMASANPSAPTWAEHIFNQIDATLTRIITTGGLTPGRAAFLRDVQQSVQRQRGDGAFTAAITADAAVDAPSDRTSKLCGLLVELHIQLTGVCADTGSRGPLALDVHREVVQGSTTLRQAIFGADPDGTDSKSTELPGYTTHYQAARKKRGRQRQRRLDSDSDSDSGSGSDSGSDGDGDGDGNGDGDGKGQDGGTLSQVAAATSLAILITLWAATHDGVTKMCRDATREHATSARKMADMRIIDPVVTSVVVLVDKLFEQLNAKVASRLAKKINQRMKLLDLTRKLLKQMHQFIVPDDALRESHEQDVLMSISLQAAGHGAWWAPVVQVARGQVSPRALTRAQSAAASALQQLNREIHTPMDTVEPVTITEYILGTSTPLGAVGAGARELLRDNMLAQPVTWQLAQHLMTHKPVDDWQRRIEFVRQLWVSGRK